MRSTSTALAAALLTAGLFAQGPWISPKSGAAQGNANSNIPYSWYWTRFMQVYNHDSFVPADAVLNITGVHYRMNKSFANGTYGGFTSEVAMFMAYGAPGIDASNANVLFDRNIDKTTRKEVIKRKKFNLPKLSNQNFDIKFPFDSAVSFVFITTRKLALVQEVLKWDVNAANTYPIDVWSNSTSPEVTRLASYTTGGGTYRVNGSFAGCPNSVPKTPRHYASTTGLKVGSSTGYVFGYSELANAPGVCIFGAVPLNITIPGTKCNLMQDLVLLLPGAAGTGSGYTKFTIPVPNDPTFGGLSFLTQLWWIDTKLAPFPYYATRGLKVTIGTGKPTPPDQHTAAQGRLKGYGLITQFQK